MRPSVFPEVHSSCQNKPFSASFVHKLAASIENFSQYCISSKVLIFILSWSLNFIILLFQALKDPKKSPYNDYPSLGGCKKSTASSIAASMASSSVLTGGQSRRPVLQRQQRQSSEETNESGRSANVHFKEDPEYFEEKISSSVKSDICESLQKAKGASKTAASMVQSSIAKGQKINRQYGSHLQGLAV